MSLREVCLSEIDLIVDAGYTKPLPLVTINNNKVELMRTIMLHYALLRSKSAIDQLAEGLSALGIIEAMKLHPELLSHSLLEESRCSLQLVRMSIIV